MSFSSKTKSNLSRIISDNRCCQKAELLALFRSDGVIQRKMEERDYYLQFVTENASVAQKIVKLLKLLFKVDLFVSVSKKKRLRKNNKYTIGLLSKEATDVILKSLEVNYTGQLEDDFHEEFFSGDCCYRAYLRGAFLGSGSVSDPEGEYHLELTTKSEEHAEFIARIMLSFDLHPGISMRKHRYVVYLKDSEQIVDFLNIINAHSALLDFENIRIVKGLRNNINRLVNCETANMNKSIDTGVRQMEAIRYIDKKIGLDKLNHGLKEVALLRLEYPEASLHEIGEMLEPPKSKSAVNHRLRKLEELADKI